MKYTVAIALFAFLACASAALPTITDLVSGTATSGSLTVQASYEAAEFDIKYYRFWVPTNVETLELEFAQAAASTCSSLSAYVYSSHVPCGDEWSTGVDVNYPCRDYGDYAYFSSSTSTIDVFPTYSEGVDLARPGSYIYVSVWRLYPTLDNDKQCDFTITPTVTTCAAGQVADNYYGTCMADGAAVTLPYTATLTGDVSSYLYKVEVPSRTAHIRVWANTTEYIYLYGSEGLPTTTSSYTNCYDSSSSDPDSANYIIDEYCYIPASGTFYINLEAYYSGEFVVGDIMFTIQTCDEMMGGWNCTYPSWNLTGVTPPSGASYGIDYDVGTGGISGYSALYFFLSAPNGTEAYYNVTTTLTAGSATVAYRRNGYSDYYNSYFYTSSESLTTDDAEVFALTWHNTYVGGDHFVGVFNTGTVAANFTVSAAAASGSSSGDSTTAAGTTGSSATSVVASFALIAALLALLF
jgi:hypothetical protein